MTQQSMQLTNLNNTTLIINFPPNAPIAMRSYLSTHHLWSACYLTELAKGIEDNHAGSPVFNSHHRAYVLGAIVCGVAFLEAAINEVYLDAADGHQSYLHTLESSKIAALKATWEKSEGKGKYLPILDKYQLALQDTAQAKIEKGRVLYQNAKLAIDLRNALVHYKPQTKTTDDRSRLEKQLHQKLQGKYPLNRLNSGSGNPFFPDHCLGYGCCLWAIDSVTNFADEFFKQLGIKPNYQIHPYSSLTTKSEK